MKIEGAAQRVTVYVGNSDTWHGRNLVTAIVEKCRELGIAGATATVGVLGFGKTSRIHRAHLLGLSEDLPERIEIVDRPEQISRILPVLDELSREGWSSSRMSRSFATCTIPRGRNPEAQPAARFNQPAWRVTSSSKGRAKSWMMTLLR